MKLRSLFITLAVLTSQLAIPLHAQLSRGPYLQLATDHSIHIAWRTTHPSSPTIRYGITKNNLDHSSSTKNLIIRRTRSESKGVSGLSPSPLQVAPKGTFQYELKIDGLKPDTLYHYALFEKGKRITPNDGTYTFRTHPTPGTARPLYIWAVGDSGTGGTNQKLVFKAMQEFNREHKLTLDMFIHVGDMAYGSGRDPEFQSNFFQIYQTTLRNTVCWPAMGNHEGVSSKGSTCTGPYYDAYITPTKGEAGGVPSATESYYSYDYGRTHFIVLNSHDLDRRPTATMAQWLKEDLAKTSTKKTDWLIAFWHHPPYTKGSHDSDREKQLIEMRTMILPILESSGVDLVLTGHSHIYERSMLIDGAYDTPTTAENHVFNDGDGDKQGDGSYKKSPGLIPNQGTVQIVTGNGGQGLGRRGYSPVMRRSLLEHGSCLISVKGNKLSAIMLNKNGKVSDRFQIDKTSTVTPKRIAKPWKSGTPTLGVSLIAKHAQWSYLAGSDPAEGWHKPAFDDSSWKVGKAGFGYSDNDDTTVLNDMPNRYSRVYLRRSLKLKNISNAKKLWLAISYDDAFILYINGREAVRKGVRTGRGKEAKGISNHDAANKFELFNLEPFASMFHQGKNTIAVEGHNRSLSSSDFTLHPTILLKKK